MKKIVRLGTTKIGDRSVNVFCKIEIVDGKLSICGVEGPMSNGNAVGSCGQIDMHRPEINKLAPGWTAAMLACFWDTWHRWHLNDMRSGCPHQRDWDTARKLELQPLTWGDKYHELRDLATEGAMTPEQYRDWPAVVKTVERLCWHNSPKHPALWGADGEAALSAGLVKVDKDCRDKTKAAGWVYPGEHPEGLLCKPCPVCGHKYGSAWLREELPAEVITFLESLPETDTQPAWV